MINYGCFLCILLISLAKLVCGVTKPTRYLNLDPPFKYYDYMCPHFPFSIGGHPWIFTKPEDCDFSRNQMSDLSVEFFGSGRQFPHSAKNMTVCCMPHVLGTTAPWALASPGYLNGNKELYKRPSQHPMARKPPTPQVKTLEDVVYDVETMHFMFIFAGAACAQLLFLLFAVVFLWLMKDKVQIGVPADHEAVVVVVHVKTTDVAGEDQPQQIDSDLQSI